MVVSEGSPGIHVEPPLMPSFSEFPLETLMDPFAHTLAGATLAATGLRHTTRYATAALLIGANLPDIDVVMTAFGEDAMLEHRRGWTHGILALVVLPVILTGFIALWHRYVANAGSETTPNVAYRPAVILALSAVAILTHPLLDWLNTYGVRLLMPFSGDWFYGDTLFIIDPWLWLLPLMAVLLAWHHHKPALITASVFAAVASLLIIGNHLTPLLVKYVWATALVASLTCAWRSHRTGMTQPPSFSRPVAGFMLLGMLTYIGTSWALARQAELHAAASDGQQPIEVQANPLPGNPLRHRLVLVYPDHYLLKAADGSEYRIERPAPDAIVTAALTHPDIRGFVNWMRFPYWEVSSTDKGWTVHLYDLRYQGPDDPAAGIGYISVDIAATDIEKW